MKKIFLIFFVLSFSGCYTTVKDHNVYAKFSVTLERPGMTEIGEDSMEISRDYFYSFNDLNIFPIFRYGKKTRLIDPANSDTVFIKVDFSKDTDTTLLGYMVYNYKNRNEPGVILSKKNYSIKVDSFFNENGINSKLDSSLINEKYRLAKEERIDQNTLVKKYVEINTGGGIPDSLLLYYSTELKDLNYAFSTEFVVPGKKLYKVVAIGKTPQSNGWIMGKMVTEIRKEPLLQKDKELIDSCIHLYKKNRRMSAE